MKITTSEILEALRNASVKPISPADAFTSADIRQLTAWSTDRVREHLGFLKARGQIEVVMVTRENLNGVTVRVPAYRFLKLKKSKKAA